jgi:hypothetical protein
VMLVSSTDAGRPQLASLEQLRRFVGQLAH